MLTSKFLDRMQNHCKLVTDKGGCNKCKYPQYCNLISLMKSNYTTLPRDFNEEVKNEILEFEKKLAELCQSLEG